jgi:hypothetical protein
MITCCPARSGQVFLFAPIHEREVHRGALAIRADQAQRRVQVAPGPTDPAGSAQRLEVEGQPRHVARGHLTGFHPAAGEPDAAAERHLPQRPALRRLVERVQREHGVLVRLTQRVPGAGLQPALDEVGRVGLRQARLDEPQPPVRAGQVFQRRPRLRRVERRRRVLGQHLV